MKSSVKSFEDKEVNICRNRKRYSISEVNNMKSAVASCCSSPSTSFCIGEAVPTALCHAHLRDHLETQGVHVLISSKPSFSHQPLLEYQEAVLERELNELSEIPDNQKLLDPTRCSETDHISAREGEISLPTKRQPEKSLEEVKVATQNKELLGLIQQALQSRQLGTLDEFIESYRQYAQASLNLPEVHARTLNALGVLYSTTGHDQQAIEAYRESILVYIHLNLPQELGRTHYNLGLALYATKDYVAATETFIQAVQTMKSGSLEQAFALYKLAKTYAKQGFLGEAIQAYYSSEKLQKNAGFVYSLAETLYSLAGAFEKQGLYERASQKYSESNTLYAQISNSDSNSTESILRNNFLELGLYTSSAAQRLICKMRKHQMNNPTLISELINFAVYREQNTTSRLARMWGLECIHTQDEVVRTLNVRGEILVRKGMVCKALPLFGKGLEYQIHSMPLLTRTRFNLGQALLQRKHYEEALDQFRKLNLCYQAVGSHEKSAETLEIISIIKHKTGDIENAIASLEQSVNLCKLCKLTEQQANSLRSLGRVFKDSRNYIPAYRKSAKLYTSLDLKQASAAMLEKLTEAILNKYTKMEAFDTYSQLLQLYQQLGDSNEYTNALGGLHELCHNYHNCEAVADIYNKKITRYTASGNARKCADSLCKLGNLYVEFEFFDDAAELFKEALAVYKKLGLEEEVAKVQMKIGGVFKNTQQYEAAIQAYTKAVGLCKQAGSSSLAKGLSRLGELFFKTGCPTKAIRAYEDSLAVYQQLDPCKVRNERPSEVLFALGKLYLMRGQYHKVIQSYQEILVNPQLIVTNQALGRLGYAFQMAGYYDQAIQTYQTLLGISQSNQTFKIGISLAETYIMSGQNDAAFALLCEQKPGWLSADMIKVTRQLGFIMETQGNLQQAIDYYQTCIRMAQKSNNIKVYLDVMMDLGTLLDKAGCYTESAQVFVNRTQTKSSNKIK